MTLRPLVLLVLLLGCSTGVPKAPPKGIVLLPLDSPSETHHAAPRPLQAPPKGTPTRAAVLADYKLADTLMLAYVGAPGSTVEGIERARVLAAAAGRAVWLLRKRGRPADISHAAAAVAELLQLVR